MGTHDGSGTIVSVSAAIGRVDAVKSSVESLRSGVWSLVLSLVTRATVVERCDSCLCP